MKDQTSERFEEANRGGKIVFAYLFQQLGKLCPPDNSIMCFGVLNDINAGICVKSTLTLYVIFDFNRMVRIFLLRVIHFGF